MASKGRNKTKNFAGGLGQLGKSIDNDRRRRCDEAQAASKSVTGVSVGMSKKSVLEQSSLDDFLNQADLAHATFESTRGEAFTVSQGPELITNIALDLATQKEREASAKKIIVPIPWRPAWNEAMSAEELASLEGGAFLEWRRGLAKMEEKQGLIMTPYERNLDFWRQLWRCIERSDVLIQILDIRDPEFYRSKDLERYVAQFPEKKHLLLLNKADFLTKEQRQRWATYLSERGVEVVFFSALRELQKQQRFVAPPDAEGEAESDEEEEEEGSEDGPEAEGKLPATAEGDEGLEEGTKLPPHGSFAGSDMADVTDCTRLLEEIQARMPPNAGPGGERRGVVGFVGYPNVGKSSVINSLFGVKKVSMSRTPGKTKHLQTLELPDSNITLCDCPGLVFPSVVATKAQLVINGTVPIAELKDFMGPTRLIVDKVGPEPILKRYGVTADHVKKGVSGRGVEDSDNLHNVLCGLANKRQHLLMGCVPDETWAARKVIHDYCTGALLYCEPPPGTLAEVAAPRRAEEDDDEDDSDFSDLEEFMDGPQGSHDRQMTKRKMRMLNKQMVRGGPGATKAVQAQSRQGGYGSEKDVRGKKSLGK
ncbi:unnamed protein product [Polarella glacialis]|uniref:CP-type G domain-containing protein n=1 Tax=Polarella glacialis TaxID=89957 RepID=A0A813KVC6_POLGL|nr:unnamed protein product [Polarella glacialis]